VLICSSHVFVKTTTSTGRVVPVSDTLDVPQALPGGRVIRDLPMGKLNVMCMYGTANVVVCCHQKERLECMHMYGTVSNIV